MVLFISTHNNTRLKKYAEYGKELGYKCSTAAALRYIWGLTSKAEKAVLLAGQAYHASVASHLVGEGIDTALVRFDEVYQDWSQVNVAADDKLAWQNTRLITQKWIEAHPTDGVAVQGWPFTVTYVEVPFEVPLTTVDGVEILFVGRMDVVGEYLNGYVVVDHKTTGFINQLWSDQWKMDGQVTGYIWAARQLLRDKPVMGAFINGVQFSKLPNDGTRKCKEHGLKIGNLTAGIPVIQGGMGVGISLSGLASAVANEGGVGVISCAGLGLIYREKARSYMELCIVGLKEEIRKTKEKVYGNI